MTYKNITTLYIRVEVLQYSEGYAIFGVPVDENDGFSEKKIRKIFFDFFTNYIVIS